MPIGMLFSKSFHTSICTVSCSPSLWDLMLPAEDPSRFVRRISGSFSEENVSALGSERLAPTPENPSYVALLVLESAPTIAIPVPWFDGVTAFGVSSINALLWKNQRGRSLNVYFSVV